MPNRFRAMFANLTRAGLTGRQKLPLMKDLRLLEADAKSIAPKF
jgi:hypothetical protein